MLTLLFAWSSPTSGDQGSEAGLFSLPCPAFQQNESYESRTNLAREYDIIETEGSESSKAPLLVEVLKRSTGAGATVRGRTSSSAEVSTGRAGRGGAGRGGWAVCGLCDGGGVKAIDSNEDWLLLCCSQKDNTAPVPPPRKKIYRMSGS